jgi:hypothetical protein
MTQDRKRAILYLSATLIIGILIGVLVPAFFGRFRERRGQPRGSDLAGIIQKVIKPDSVQSGKIRPIIQQTSTHIDVLQNGCNREMDSIMYSLRTQLQPFLRPDQFDQLNNFLSKGRRGGKGK